MNQDFVISDAYIELNKLLKASGLCGTGGHAKIVIEDELVTVNGVIETRKRRKINAGMIVKFETNSITVVKKQ
ncbi:RNA-binding S4 domain-containing protein [bacterium]|nr:RNA-binding S4 domain-containing protein [bacterium]